MKNSITHWALGVCLFLSCLSPAVGAESTPQWTWEDPAADRTKLLDISDDGGILAVGTLEQGAGSFVVAAFDQSSNHPLFRMEIPSSNDYGVGSMDLSADGRILAFTTENELFVYELPSTLLMYHVEPAGNLGRTSLNLDGSLLTAMSVDARVHLFDVIQGSLLWTDDVNQRLTLNLATRDLHISDDGAHILVSFYTQGAGIPIYVALYETAEETPELPVWLVEEPEPLSNADMSMARDGEHYAVATSSQIRYYDMSEPVGGVKETLWEAQGSGITTLGQNASMSWDGSVVARFNECWETGFTSPGAVELYTGENGALLWNEEEFRYYDGQVSADGNRLAFADGFTRQTADPTHYIYDLGTETIIWEAVGFGKIRVSGDGSAYAVGSGRHYGGQIRYPLQHFRIEENLPPDCQVLSPTSGEVLSGLVTLSGTFDDVDDPVDRVEVETPLGVFLAELYGGSQGTWFLETDLSTAPTGPFTLRARAVDERYKHGAWDEVPVILEPPEETPTPVPTSTPEPTIVPEPTVTPLIPTPTPTMPPTEELTLELLQPSRLFQPGDAFWLQAMVLNPDEPIPSVAMVMLLQVGGTYHAWPSWTRLAPDAGNLDYSIRPIPFGESRYEIIPPLSWPEGVGQAYGLVFLGALLSPELDELLCLPAYQAWGYSD